MFDLSGKTVLITGASRGIGESSARAFAKAGANVVLFARSNADVSRIAQEIGDKALAITGDVSRFADVAGAMDKTIAHFGALDILINNAGVLEPIAPLADSDPDAWGAVIDINLKGVYYGLRAALPVMEKAGQGTIITISSGAAHNALEGWSQYCTSKAGAAMLTSCAHLEASANLRIMGMSPGTVATQMQRDIKASGVNAVSQLDWDAHIPAEWTAKALLWMCSPDADEFLGQEIPLRDEGIRRRIGLTK